MAMVVPNVGEVLLLTNLLAGGTLENWTLKLFKTNVTPAETDTAGSYTEADFTNYVAKTLTRSVGAGTWSAPASGAPTNSWSGEASVAESVYGSSAQSWTCGASGNTVYGYYIVGSTSTTLVAAEAFATPRTLASGDSLSFSPRFGAA